MKAESSGDYELLSTTKVAEKFGRQEVTPGLQELADPQTDLHLMH